MFNFGKFNKKQLFVAETTGDEEYTNLQYLYERDGEGAVYTIKALYIGTKSNFDPEVPLLLIDDYYVNLPVHQLSEIKEMLANPQAIAAINNGQAAFTIASYFQKRFNRTCYKAVWCNAEEE